MLARILARKGCKLLRDKRGIVAIWLGLCLTTLAGAASLAIDLSSLYVLRNKLQTTADAAALAAAVELPDATNVETVAVQYAEFNLPVADHGDTLMPTDVVRGNWNSGTKTFTPGGAPENAVQVTLRRSQANGNPAQTFLAGLIGFDSVDVVTGAIAVAGESNQNECFRDGVFAGGGITVGQDINMAAGVCFYGRDGVNFGQDAIIAEGALIGALDLNTIQFGQDPQVPDGAIVEVDMQPELALNVAATIDDLEAGINLPPQISSVEVVNSLPGNLVSGTAYIVNGSVSINQDISVTDVIIAARGSISWGQDGAIRNTAMGSEYGTNIGVLATDSISIGQDAVVEGVDLISGANVSIGQDLFSLSARVQAAGNIALGQDPNLTGALAPSIPNMGGGAISLGASRLVL